MRRRVSRARARAGTWVLALFAFWAACADSSATAGPSTADPDPFVLGPPASDGPVMVTARFRVRDVNDIDDASERFEFGGVLELVWKDERQAFDPAATGMDEMVYQGRFQFDEISPAWYPQIVLVNESGLFEVHGTVLRVAPDGTCRLVQLIDAAAEADLDLRRYPFDEHRLEATFAVLDAKGSELQLRTDQPALGPEEHRVAIPQWELRKIAATTRVSPEDQSIFVVSIDAKRAPFFVVRLVVIPLLFIVMLSWSVFWMGGSSLGDRLGVSFIGILTAVAYQIVVADIQPDIAYVTLMHGFLNLSFLLMCAAVVVNLAVGAFERAGDPDRARAVDRKSRWIFPLLYFGLNGVIVAIAFIAF